MSRLFDKFYLKSSVVDQMKARAIQFRGVDYNNHAAAQMKIDHCTAEYRQKGLSTVLIFTMDDGMHSIGWWKNPEYARCWHLSLSFRYPDLSPRPRINKDTLEWVEMFFHPNANWVWSEPAFTKSGKKMDVWHYRLFADEHWQPIFPRGEVYSTLKTEVGWKSWSEVQEEIKKQEEEQREKY